MTGKGPKAQAGAAAQAAAEERQRRSAEALRANLRRRKGQARDRAEDGADEAVATGGVGLPKDPAKPG